MGKTFNSGVRREDTKKLVIYHVVYKACIFNKATMFRDSTVSKSS